MAAKEKCGILLVNTGTPSAPKPRAVRKYLAQFLGNPRIVPMNRVAWWFILHLFILPSRGRASAKKYAQIWTPEGSPFAVAHERLQNALQVRFEKDGHDVALRCAMSFGEPSLLSAVRRLRAEGCTRLVVLPLYPQSAYSTTGVATDGVQRALRRARWDVPYQVIDNYHDNPTYIQALAASVRHAGFQPESGDKLLFSYHAIPMADVERGDTYELQTGASSLQIASELGIERTRWTIGYQCRFDKGRDWLSPTTSEVLDRWAETGTKRLFFVCPGFAADCLETLYDIEHELKPRYVEAARRASRAVAPDGFVYVPCLDKSRAHVRVLYDVLLPYVAGGGEGGSHGGE